MVEGARYERNGLLLGGQGVVDMVGLVIASHGHLAEELLATAKLIIGEIPGITACSVGPAASPEEIRKLLSEAVKTVDTGDGVIVFADLVGGSPCTQSLSLCRHARIEVVTGVNLPMLLKANSLRSRAQASLPMLAHDIAEYGRRSITCASEALRQVQDQLLDQGQATSL